MIQYLRDLGWPLDSVQISQNEKFSESSRWTTRCGWLSENLTISGGFRCPENIVEFSFSEVLGFEKFEGTSSVDLL